MLKVGKYTLRDKARRTASIRERERVSATLEVIFRTLAMIQPSAAELELAVEFEERAARLSVDFDSGESQLLAILIIRAWPLLITGDKRAITAIAAILGKEVNGKIACLEQLVATAVTIKNFVELRTAVCHECDVDRAVTNCFACSSKDIDAASVLQGLASYVEDVRRKSGSILLEGPDLSTAVAVTPPAPSLT